MEFHKGEGGWTCDNCSYQTYCKDNLRRHNHKANLAPGNQPEERDQEDWQGTSNTGKKSNTCNICNKDFVYKNDLGKHMRETHKTYKPCNNLNNCAYGEKCTYNHRKYPEGSQGLL